MSSYLSVKAIRQGRPSKPSVKAIRQGCPSKSHTAVRVATFQAKHFPLMGLLHDDHCN